MSLVRRLCLAGVVLGFAACGGQTDDSTMWTALDEANLDAQPAQVCTPGAPDPRACAATDTKKTTVCHIPPGNPANEHTICVGDPSVKAHLAHGDKLGSCCGAGGGGSGGSGGGGSGGAGGGGSGGGGGGSGGTGGTGGGGGGAGGTGGTGGGGGGGAGGTGGTGGGGGGDTGGGTPGADMGSTGGGPIG
jgi:hypothetical protein